MSVPDDTPSLLNTLAGVSPFCHLTREAAAGLIERTEARHFAPDELIIAQGDPADGLHVIVEGDALVRLHHHDGHDSVLADVGPKDVVGEMAILTSEPRGADVVAKTPVTTRFLSSARFNEIAARHPELSVVLTEILADRLGSQSEDVLGGKHIEGFRIVRCVGRGGMAVVYEAEDVEGHEGRVALKMMNHRLLFKAGAMARFQREADILMSLAHPHITRVSRCFAAYRTSFLVMEFCDGVVLDDFLKERGPLPEDLARAAIGQLASALAYLHECRVMHRDLKPGNVMVCGDTVKLTDFGLARTWDPDPISTGLTTEGAVLGTPYYMSADQILGRDVGLLGDVYSLGCLGLEMLLGRVPFSSRDIAGLLDEKRQFAMPSARDLSISQELHGVLEGFLGCVTRGEAPDLAAVAAWGVPLPGA